MKSEFRRELARQSFEEKIRKVGELIRLSGKMKRQRLRGSLKGTTAMDVFMSERKREGEL
ncbi:MAG: hypothetical protein DME98_00065 [Verrucomicrobia bacterium]|jgi:hypothetical protein|nr:MAG: hypothetical protein DME98_00065 [Verrucomicrobiota bacterium]PYJ32790.1 MAG: hypothetical protein DME88_09850 [Verrucomicrobiota bacterium]